MERFTSSSSPPRPTNDTTLAQGGARTKIGSDAANPALSVVLQMTPWSAARMPFLALLRDRLAAKLAASLRTLTGATFLVGGLTDQSTALQSFLDQLPDGALVAELQATGMSDVSLVTMDRTLAFCIMGMMLGGRDVESAPPDAVRELTNIEHSLLERTVREIVASLNHGLEAAGGPSYELVQTTDHPQHAVLEHPLQPSLVFQFQLTANNHTGTISLAIPHAILKPMVDFHDHNQQRALADPAWTQSLTREFMMANVDVDVILEQSMLRLEDVMHWSVGTQLDLRATPDARVTMACGGTPLFAASVGHRGKTVAACIEDILFHEEEAS